VLVGGQAECRSGGQWKCQTDRDGELGVQTYNGFSAWPRVGNAGVIADNDPVEQEKIIKFNSLLANCVVFHTALDMTGHRSGADRRGLGGHRRTAGAAVAPPDRAHHPVRHLTHR